MKSKEIIYVSVHGVRKPMNSMSFCINYVNEMQIEKPDVGLSDNIRGNELTGPHT